MATKLRLGELFAGYGGLGLAIEEVFDAELAWVSEFEDGPSKILAHHWPDVTNYGDITKINWADMPPVDILSGGFPCQDLSLAGRRKGMRDGTRSGLWANFFEGISVLRPMWVAAENVRGILSGEAHSDVEPCPWCVGDTGNEPCLRALGAVLADLASIGYDAQWIGLRAADVGAPHGRFRVFILAHDSRCGDEVVHDAGGIGGHETLEHDGRSSQANDGASLPDQSDSDAGWAGSVREASEDADLTAGGERREPTPGHSEGGRPRTDTGGRSGTPTADADRGECDGREREQVRGEIGREATAGNREGLPADPESHAGRQFDGDSGAPAVNWGEYEPAIQRWEQALGRRAPTPTEPTGRNGGHRLSARFTEWMMGLPDGWITDVPGITRNEALKAAGNGVCPQQAIAGFNYLRYVAQLPPTI